MVSYHSLDHYWLSHYPGPGDIHPDDVKEKYGFPKYFTTNWLKNSHEKIINIARILQSAGITTDITLSVQSLNERTLEIIKRKNLTDEKMFLLKKIFHDEKIPTYTELILPFPV